MTRLEARTAAAIREQRIYLEVGDRDEFEFQLHYEHISTLLRDKGITVQEGPIQGSCTSIPSFGAPHVFVTYEGGHVGIPDVDDSVDVLLGADFCGEFPIWRRLLSMLGFLNESFPDGDFGAGGPRFVGDTLEPQIVTPALSRFDGDLIERQVWIYRPPAFFNTTHNFPIVYFLGGYGQTPADFARLAQLLDILITTGVVQNFYFAVLPGDGGRRGSFYVDHVIPHDQVPDIAAPTSGRYESAILDDLIPAIEDDILNGRIRR